MRQTLDCNLTNQNQDDKKEKFCKMNDQISSHNLVGNMREAVERLRPHNSTLFRLRCLYICKALRCICSKVYRVLQCIIVFAVHATFGPLLLGGSRQWNQEVLCLPSLPLMPLCLSAMHTLHCTFIAHCTHCTSESGGIVFFYTLHNASRTTSVQWTPGIHCCRENGPTQRSLPPIE